jgi:hypothetical protein
MTQRCLVPSGHSSHSTAQHVSVLTTTCVPAGTAGRLLVDDDRLLPFNKQRETDKPIYTMKNGAERIPQTQLR